MADKKITLKVVYIDVKILYTPIEMISLAYLKNDIYLNLKSTNCLEYMMLMRALIRTVKTVRI